MDLGTVIQSEVSQKEKKQILCNNAPMQKNDTDVLTGKAEIETQMQRTNGWRLGGARGGMNWEAGIDIYTLLCIKQITSENLLCGTGDSTQHSVVT